MSRETRSIKFARRGAAQVPAWIEEAKQSHTADVQVLSSLSDRGVVAVKRVPTEPPPPPEEVERKSDTFPISQRPPAQEVPFLEIELEKVERLQDSLCGAIEELNRARHEHMQKAEGQLIDLALALAERLAGDQIEADPSRVRCLVAEGLEALTAEDRYEVELGSTFSSVVDHVREHIATMGLTCVVTVNPSLQASAVVVRSELGSVDESLKSRLEMLTQSVYREVGT